jgi:hypothetical protein
VIVLSFEGTSLVIFVYSSLYRVFSDLCPPHQQETVRDSETAKFLNGICPSILQFYPRKHSFNFVKLPTLCPYLDINAMAKY